MFAAHFTAGFGRTHDGTSIWTRFQPHMPSVCRQASGYFFTEHGGLILRSADGLLWEECPAQPASEGDVYVANGIVAVQAGSSVYFSANGGVSWSTGSLPSGAAIVGAVGEKFFAVNTTTRYSYTSSDLSSWSTSTQLPSGYGRVNASGGFAAWGKTSSPAAVVKVSSNGTSWVDGPLNTYSYIDTTGGEDYLIGYNGAENCFFNTSGYWPLPTIYGGEEFIFDGTKWLWYGYDYTPAEGYSESADGHSWTSVSSTSNGFFAFSDINGVASKHNATITISYIHGETSPTVLCGGGSVVDGVLHEHTSAHFKASHDGNEWKTASNEVVFTSVDGQIWEGDVAIEVGRIGELDEAIGYSIYDGDHHYLLARKFGTDGVKVVRLDVPQALPDLSAVDYDILGHIVTASGRVVVVVYDYNLGANKLVYSDDGFNTADSAVLAGLPEYSSPSSVAYFDGKYRLFVEGAVYECATIDGTYSLAYTLPSDFTISKGIVLATNERLFALATYDISGTNTMRIYESDDGVSWSLGFSYEAVDDDFPIVYDSNATRCAVLTCGYDGEGSKGTYKIAAYDGESWSVYQSAQNYPAPHLWVSVASASAPLCTQFWTNNVSQYEVQPT